MRVIYVDTRSSLWSGPPSDGQLRLNRTLVVPQGGRFRLDNIRLPVVWNTVTQLNQNLYYRDGLVYRHAQIARGLYDSPSLAAAIQAAFAAQGGSAVSVTYDADGGSTTFTIGSAWQLLTDAQLLGLSGHYLGVNVSNPASFNAQLQWPSTGVTVVGPTPTIYTFPFVSAQGYDTIYIQSGKLSNAGIQGPFGQSSVICVVPIDVGWGEVQAASSPLTVWQELGPLNIDTLDFQLTDLHGNAINLLAGNWSFQLSVDDLQ